MDPITFTQNAAHNLTTFKAVGRINAKDIIAAAEKAYETQPTDLMLWDFTEADGSDISADQLKGIAQKTGVLSKMRKNPRTALVYGRTFGFGMGRMFETFAEAESVSVTFRIFTDIDDACAWLFQKDDLK